MTNPIDTHDQSAPATSVRRRERPRPSVAPIDNPGREASTPRALANYDVGYGKPPKHSQFRPGQSGNPNGRPKGAKGLSVLLREESLSKVTLRENGKEVSITKQEAAIKRLFSDALSGKVTPMKLLLPLLLSGARQVAIIWSTRCPSMIRRRCSRCCSLDGSMLSSPRRSSISTLARI